MNLAKDIAFLLYKHNCVIIPGFGAFLVNEKEAERNLAAKFAMPRGKTITFNAQIKNNDGLLANYLSNKKSYSYEQGVAEIKTYIEEINEKLETKRNAEVSEVGTFYLTKEQKLIFVPYHSVNFELSSYGLPKLRLKTIETRTSPTVVEQNTITKPITLSPVAKAVEKTETKPVLKTENRIATQERKRGFQLENKRDKEETIKRPRVLTLVNTLGSVFIIALLSGIVYFEITNSNSNNSYADLLSSPSTIAEPEITSTIDEANSETMAAEEHEVKSESVDVAQKVQQVDPPKIKVADTPRKLDLYAVCTVAQADTFAAEKLKEELLPTFKGAFVWNENGNYRVQIVALSKENVAKEYLIMAQKKMKQQLVIKQK